jgi:hypothetical protein
MFSSFISTISTFVNYTILYKYIEKYEAMKYKLKNSVIEIIKTDAVLYGRVAAALGTTPAAFIQTLKLKSSKLTQIAALKVISEHLGVEQEELIEPVEEPETV